MAQMELSLGDWKATYIFEIKVVRKELVGSKGSSVPIPQRVDSSMAQ